MLSTSHKAVILSEAPRRSIAYGRLMARSRRTPAMLVAKFLSPNFIPGPSAPNTPYRLFRGWPIHSHSIFVARFYPTLFPQMDVWPRYLCVGLVKGSRTVRNTHYPSARRTYSAGSRRMPSGLTVDSIAIQGSASLPCTWAVH
jgi:hypothetical protein